jgi:hypothetical protein
MQPLRLFSLQLLVVMVGTLQKCGEVWITGDSWWLVRLVFWATVIFVGIRLAWALVLMM